MMSKGEIAAYLGMANVMMASALSDIEPPDETNIMEKVRQALLEAQIYMTQEALKEAMENGKETV